MSILAAKGRKMLPIRNIFYTFAANISFILQMRRLKTQQSVYPIRLKRMSTGHYRIDVELQVVRTC